MNNVLNKKDSKQHILDVAAGLIARKGFAAVGIREIASKAKVNISMISYYFGGKVGILKEINRVYYEKISYALKEIKEDENKLEIYFTKYTEILVNFFVEKRDYCRVAILELPLEHPEIAEYKLEMIKINRKYMREYLKEKYYLLDKYQQVMIGPAFISLVFSNFLLSDLTRKTSKVNFDKKFYKKYSRTISTLFLYGMKGVVMENLKKKNEKK